jgi:hypothetical protein
MPWYTDSQIYHYLKYGDSAGASKRRFKSEEATDQYPRPTQESQKRFKPFQQVRERREPPPNLTLSHGAKPVYNKKPHKNIAYILTEESKPKK